MEAKNSSAQARKWRGRIFFLLLLTAFALFFTRLYPVMVYDSDDWLYISAIREAYPIWGDWNPTRVFPEVLMPLCGNLAGQLVYPLIGDYVKAQTLVLGGTVALFVTLYLFSFYGFLSRRFRLPDWGAEGLTVLFAALHFWALRVNHENNCYLFRSINVTGYFYYTIPALLGACLIFLLESDFTDSLWKKEGWLSKGFFLLAVYMAVFSNLYGSQVLAIYCGVRWLKAVWQWRQKALSAQGFRRETILLLGIVAAWLVGMVFELNGGRADMVTVNMGKGMLESLHTLLQLRHRLNPLFLAFCGLTVLGACALTVYRKKPDGHLLDALLWQLPCAALSAVYLVLLCGRVNPGYVEREDVLLGLALFCLMAVVTALAWLMERLPALLAVLPLLLCILLCDTNTSGRTFRESNVSNLHWTVCAAVDNAIIQQLKEAEANGAHEAVVRVPLWGPEDNWPHLDDGARYAKALYKQGVLSRYLAVSLEFDEDFQEDFQICLER